MSAQFVRYTPDIEAIEPYFHENLQIVIDKLEEYVAGSVTSAELPEQWLTSSAPQRIAGLTGESAVPACLACLLGDPTCVGSRSGPLRLVSRRFPPRLTARRAPPSRRLATRWPSLSMSRPVEPGRS